MRLLLVCLIFVLGGCATPHERVVMVPTEVKVPVTVRCSVKFPSEPEKLNVGALGPSLRERVVSLIQEGIEYRGYAALLLSALRSCADDSGAPAPDNPKP